MNYTEVNFTITPYSEAIADVLISELGNIGYDGFSYTDQGFTAYIPSKEYHRQQLEELQMLQYFSEQAEISIDTKEIEDQNYNHVLYKVIEQNQTRDLLILDLKFLLLMLNHHV